MAIFGVPTPRPGRPTSLIHCAGQPAGTANAPLFDCGITAEGLTAIVRSEEHTSELQSLMRISYAVFCLKNKKKENNEHTVCSVLATIKDQQSYTQSIHLSQ